MPIRTARLTGAGPQPCAAAKLPGVDSNHRGQGSGPCWGHRRPTRNRVRAARFELAHAQGLNLRSLPLDYARWCRKGWPSGWRRDRCRSTGSLRAPPEPRTLFPGVRARCITRHACSAQSPTGELNPAHQLGRLAHHHNACEAQWFPEDSNLAPAALHAAALPDELENQRPKNRGRTGRARTGDLLFPKQARCLLRHHPLPYSWTAPESNRETFSLQGSCSTS